MAKQAALVLTKDGKVKRFKCLIIGENAHEYCIQALQPLPIPGRKVLQTGERGWVPHKAIQF